ncbi:unnamed protein product [Cyclocybe aegerita]|uniref:BD-FAE-like domain-containing protein n=1 Tax=Cyclocybe aegerita TaxID=1973307 RepID=A0A8S0WU52_CYCAE|nr:unnamed protein product [Cyclocybe aegerita]
MGGFDWFDSVTGACPMYSTYEVADYIYEWAEWAEGVELSELAAEGQPSGRHEGTRPCRRTMGSLSSDIWGGLHYSEEDVEASRKLVLITRHHALYDDSVVVKEDRDAPFPGDDFGRYKSEDPDDPNEYNIYHFGGKNSLIVSRTAWYILKSAAPAVAATVLGAISSKTGGQVTAGHITGIDYGPASYIIDQDACWGAICGTEEIDEMGKFWKDLLTQDKSDEEIIYDAWRGPGNMWVFVRPDRFPISETISAKELPTFPVLDMAANKVEKLSFSTMLGDILLSIWEHLPVRSICALMTTSKMYRAYIFPHANSICHRRLIAYEPWYLPVGPFQTPHGREEIEWWESKWSQGIDIPISEIDSKIPWLLFRRECSSSMTYSLLLRSSHFTPSSMITRNRFIEVAEKGECSTREKRQESPLLDPQKQRPRTKEIIAPGYPLLEANRNAIESINRRTFVYKSTDPGALELDIYYPLEEEIKEEVIRSKAPILIFFYGGGLVHGSRSSPPSYLVYNNLAAFFASRGILTVIPDYRLVPNATYPQGSEDLRDAILWSIQNILEGDPGRLHVLTHSAGAIHMAGLLLKSQLFQPIKGRIRSISLMGFPCVISPSRAELYSNALKYYGSAQTISKEQPLGLLKRANEKYISSLPPIRFIFASSEPKTISTTMRFFFKEFRAKGGRIMETVLDGHDHMSPVLALGSESGEEWGEELASLILK